MSPEDRASLARRAVQVLEQNRRGAWTCPANGIYPHQWLWDSCFVAIGLARARPGARRGRAARAVPRPVGERDAPAHDLRRRGARRRAAAGSGSRSDMPDRAARRRHVVHHPAPARRDRRRARRRALPDRRTRRASSPSCSRSSSRYHAWLYRERDPQPAGLVTLIHPWECGLDTTPPWMHALDRMPLPWWLRVASALRLARVVRFLRHDTRYLPAAERPSDDDGLRMLVLVTWRSGTGSTCAGMPPRDSVLIEDLAFNAILDRGEPSARARSRPRRGNDRLDPSWSSGSDRTERALEELWDERDGPVLLAQRGDRRADRACRPSRRSSRSGPGRCPRPRAAHSSQRLARAVGVLARVPGAERADRRRGVRGRRDTGRARRG